MTGAPNSIGSLPPGWHLRRLGEVVDFTKRPRGLRLPDEIAFLPMAMISEDGADIHEYETRWGSTTRGGVYFEEDDVLLARISPCFENGKQGIAREVPGGWGIATTEIYALSSSVLGAKYLALLLRSPEIHRELLGRMEGVTGRMRLPREALDDLWIPVPPETIGQDAVLQRLSELLELVDQGCGSLRQAHAGCTAMRAAVLREIWEIDAEPGVIADVAKVFVGATPSRKRLDFWNGDIPWVSSGEVAFCRIKDTREKVTLQGIGNLARRVHPPGTVMLAMIGEGKTRGQAAILDVAAAHNQNSAAIRLDPDLMLPEFLYYVLMSRYEITRQAGTGSQQPALNKAKVEALEVPRLSTADQSALVGRIESALAGISEFEATLEENLAEASDLRSSVLHHAFAGKLMASAGQSPNGCQLTMEV